MKFAICNEMFEDWSFEAICELVADCGYEGIELAPFTLHEDPSKLTESRAREIGKIAESVGLHVTGFHWLLAKPPGLHLTTPARTVRERTTAFLQHLSRLCAATGGRFMVFGSPAQRNLPSGVAYSDGFERACDVFRAVCEEADKIGVTLALEPLGHEETNFMVTTEQTLHLVQAIDHPACRLHLDVKAMCSETLTVPKTIETYVPHLAYFHANDANLRGPGFGDVDFVPILSALRRTGYEGWVSVEVFDYLPDPKTIARKSIDYLRHSLAQGKA